MSNNKLIIVESPTKAKTIQKYLPDYEVVASVGHVRDLPKNAAEIPAELKEREWSYLGVDVENNFQPYYVIPEDKKKVIELLKTKAKKVQEIYFATDEDREGESISWHIKEVLKPKVPYYRMVFHEITKEAILKALVNTRTIDENLVHAQEARRILDRLVGYTLSPLLWKKIAVGLSAGRVQSVVLRLIVLREKERISFVKSQYANLKVQFEKDKKEFTAQLTKVQGKPVAAGVDFDPKTGQLLDPKSVVLLDKKKAEALKDSLAGKDFLIQAIEEKKTRRNPPLPFITSSLQQEANRKLRLGARQTMRVAQSLYEKGFITYMRTDSPNLSKEAIERTRALILETYGKDYVKTTIAKNKATKGAQEAHEAIRPAGNQYKVPKDTDLTGVEYSLYDLVWKRTLASEMQPAEINQTTIFFDLDGNEFRAHGKEILFAGYLKAFEEAEDEDKHKSDETYLPKLKEKEKLAPQQIDVTEHQTEEPARYNEASIVKLMEKEGIGRPSTYASIIETLMDRGYILKKNEVLFPSVVAFAVADLLAEKYPEIVDIHFSARMEKALDDISEGNLVWNKYLKDFYGGKDGLKATTERLTQEVSPSDYRVVDVKGLKVRIGRFGPFVEWEESGVKKTSSVPVNTPPADLSKEDLLETTKKKNVEDRELGLDPTSGKKVYYFNGIYGPYLQLGENEEKGKKNAIKPKRLSLTGIAPDKVTLELALQLLELPATLGKNPETGYMIQKNLGRFGPYVAHMLPKKPEYRKVKDIETLLALDFDQALAMVKAPQKSFFEEPLKVFPSKDESEKIAVFKGRFGHYLKYKDINVSIPKNRPWQELSFEEADELVQKKLASGPTAKPKAAKRAVKLKKK